MHAHRSIATLLALLAAGAAWPAPGDKPVPPLAPSTQQTEIRTRTASLPARGLFEGDRLSAAGRERLADLVLDALGLQVEVALLVPTGPWKIEERGGDERALTPARLASVKRFLADRGVDPKHIFVESRIDRKIAEPRLDVQIVGRPGTD